MRLPIVHHPGYTIPWPEVHPFPMAKFRALREYLAALGFDDDPSVEWLTPQPASSAQLLRVHGHDYLQTFYLGDSDPKARRRSGFPWSPALVERTLLEVGGTLLTVEMALETGLACNTAGGTHHAFANGASGYCLLNDIAVAAREALARGWVKRVLVVDLDVHQGDGTAAIFQNESAVFTFSIHGADNFPFTKQSSGLDVALPRGTGDDAYLDALAAHLPRLLKGFRPELVIYDAGADVHRGDRLGHLDLSDDGVYARDRYVIDTCRTAGIATACVIGGGYDRDLAALAARHAQLHRAARAAIR